jgi:hypothetical protein
MPCLEPPTIPSHETLYICTLDSEVLADIRNLRGVGFLFLFCYDASSPYMGSCHDKRIGHWLALEALLFAHKRLEMPNRKNLSQKESLLSSRRNVQASMIFYPVAQPTLWQLQVELVIHFADRNHRTAIHSVIESLPECRKAGRVIVTQHPKTVRVKDVDHARLCFPGKKLLLKARYDLRFWAYIEVIGQLIQRKRTLIEASEGKAQVGIP